MGGKRVDRVLVSRVAKNGGAGAALTALGLALIARGDVLAPFAFSIN